MNWYRSFIHWLELHQGACIYHKYFGVDCPGCGMQRSFIELLKGNFYESFIIYPALLPLMGMFIFLLFHLKFKFPNGARILIYWFILNVLIIVISYIVKMV